MCGEDGMLMGCVVRMECGGARYVIQINYD